jgi:hypothetical protein
MVTAHEVVAVAALAVTAIAALTGGLAYARNRPAGQPVSHLLALAQTVLVAQVGLGLLLLSDDRRTADDLHYLYGVLALAVVLSPWLYAPADRRRRLAWFAVATLVAGALAVRAYMTAS